MGMKSIEFTIEVEFTTDMLRQAQVGKAAQ